jgi:hypothetical protein
MHILISSVSLVLFVLVCILNVLTRINEILRGDKPESSLFSKKKAPNPETKAD